MKGRVIALGQIDGRQAAALVVDGRVEDLVVDDDNALRPGSICRAIADRPLKGQGGMTMKLPGAAGFFRNATGLKPGQSLLVQVGAVPETGKAIPVSDRILLKGRAAIVTPRAPGMNISRRIRDDEARMRLHDLAGELAGDRGWGMILRSAAADIGDDEIGEELSALLDLADTVMADQGDQPELLVAGADAHEFAWREWSVPEPDAVDQDAEAFDTHGVWDAIEVARGPEEPLEGGAYLYVEPTRALVAVDVNTGADTGPGAALKANLAAAKALPRALRLRGLGGQITVDFAPLSKRDRRLVEQALKSAFRSDPVDTALVGWSPIGHFELQRKRERAPLV